MKLRELFDRMKPMFTGKATPAETAEAIYGDAADQPSGKRLVIYDRVRGERTDELRFAFPATALQLGDAFDAIAYDYFKLHPWGAADYRPDGAPFSEFLRGRDPRAWIPDLARLEWEVFSRRQLAPHPPETADTLRLGSLTRILTFEYDVAWWLLAPSERSPDPPRRVNHVVVWVRDSGESRFSSLADHQRQILEHVAAGTFEIAAIPASFAATEHALRGFVVSGILVGPAPESTEMVPTLGSDLAAIFTLAPFVQVRWEDGAMQLWSPLCAEVIASDDVDLMLVASRFATPCSVGDAVAALADRMQPADVVEIADALSQSQLLVCADAPVHPAVRAGWDPHEAVAYAITRESTRVVEPGIDADGDRVAAPPVLEAILRDTGSTTCELVLQLAVPFGDLAPGRYRYDPADQQLVTLAGASPYAEPCVVEVTARAGHVFAAGGSLLSLHFAAGWTARSLDLASAAHGRAARAVDVVPSDEPWSMLVLGAFAL